MKKLALAPIGILLTLAVAACSLVVNADRSKVNDDLYRPAPIDSMPTPDAGEDAGEDAATPEAGVAGAAGAAGAAGEAGAGGAIGASAAGAGGV